jgi:hypothetical protein
LQGHDHRIWLVIQRRTGGRIDAHADQPAKQKVAREARGPCARNFLVRGMICGSYPSLLTVTVMSALRLATTTHGVTQVVGTLSPETSAVAPDGVLEMEMFSVVPRVTDAQPTHGAASAAANSNLIIGLSPFARCDLHATYG